MNKSEELIFKARLTGLSFVQLTKEEVKRATDQIITRCAAISGCELPGTEYFADILANEIVVFLTDYGYAEYTIEEIITALRLNTMVGARWPSGLEIERIDFKGSVFNIDYFSRVLAQYNQMRHILNRRFENFIDGHE